MLGISIITNKFLILVYCFHIRGFKEISFKTGYSHSIELVKTFFHVRAAVDIR